MLGWSCSSVHDYCQLPSTVGMHCPFAVCWLSAYSVMLLMCSCMVFIVDTSGYDMLMSSVMLVIFMLVSMPCSSR